ncbi:MAG TPA: tRNA (adenosine(37)-N6)-dimethylallyltransferase MiaA [Bacteroidetes bacterium]|nr:tRNA (adenosine(37)-N6)-dimethylallyltransferase MiaA [Bacteroidota bacterium]
MNTGAPILTVLGPTASGKSALAIRMARSLGGEILSADSRQCYRGMLIGTSATTPEEQEGIPHHYVQTVSPHASETASSFQQKAASIIEETQSRNTPLIIVGGSTLYLQALLFPLEAALPSEAQHLEALQEEEKSIGLAGLYQKLESVDPAYASQMDGLNRQRILRALDVWMQTGRPFSSFHTQHKQGFDRPTNPLFASQPVFGLFMERAILHERIAARVQTMIDKGLQKEVESLLNDGCSWDSNPMKSVGYREWKPFFEGKATLLETREAIVIATRQYAKRQMTWFRRWPFIQWIQAGGNH